MSSPSSKSVFAIALIFLLLLVFSGVFVITYLTVTNSDRIDLAAVVALIESLAGLSSVQILKIYRRERDWEKLKELLESLSAGSSMLKDEALHQLLTDTYRKHFNL